MIVISGCDKTGAAAMMPLARTNDVGLVGYPGTSSPGCVNLNHGRRRNNLTVLDWAKHELLCWERITPEEFEEVERNVMPGSGTCGAVYGTMSTIPRQWA